MGGLTPGAGRASSAGFSDSAAPAPHRPVRPLGGLHPEEAGHAPSTERPLVAKLLPPRREAGGRSSNADLLLFIA